MYRTVLEYYSGDPDEDAYGIVLNTLFQYLFISLLFNKMIFPDMRKALSRDIEKKSVIPLEHPVKLDDCD